MSKIGTAEATQLAKEYYQINVSVKKLPGEMDLNFYLSDKNGKEYILKINHPDSSIENLEFQNAAIRHLESKKLSLQLPKLNESINNQLIEFIKDEEGKDRPMRLLDWVQGRLWAKVNPHSPDLLKSLGKACAEMVNNLNDFDHPGAHRFLKWNPSELLWIKDHLDVFQNEEEKEIVLHFLNLFEEEVIPIQDSLPKSIIHGDANDYNVIVSEDLMNPKVVSIIDFGDAMYTHTINELGIACAYALMDKKDPIEIAQYIIQGYVKNASLKEEEVKVLFPFIAARLLITVTNSAINKVKEPENEYLVISERPAWDLLKKLRKVPSQYAHYRFREACGWEPCPNNTLFEDWLNKNEVKFSPVVKFDRKDCMSLDLSVGSLDLGHNENFEKIKNFERTIDQIIRESDKKFGIGGYGEVRPFYTTDAYLVEGNDGPHWRTVHLGLDIWGEAGTPVYAPLNGKVHSFQNNEGDCNYGPTIILEHEVDDTFSFYTLYGHLSLESIKDLKVGQLIKSGAQIATFGAAPINGNWPPHLHFQVMLDMLEWEGDFPGVGFPNEQKTWMSICPNPICFLPSLKGLFNSNNPFSKGQILGQRKQHLGRNLSISYQKPLYMRRAYMQYLYEADGRRYLDTVNNVPHVGHQNAKVVRAAKRQLNLLNTNTRYLHEEIIQYAEELLEMFPPELCVVNFVNSGSEANELAIRMAKTYTGQKDMVALEVGYHGNTNACIEVSSYKFDGKGGKGAPTHTRVVPIPDDYRGKYRMGEKDLGKKYADEVQSAIHKIKQEGRGVAAFIGESILSCGGQIVPPANFFKEAYGHIRAAGGLCIADEVQVGFGRVGDTFWGFELHDVVPDIVTLGKPIGNGHPLGAVVCTKEVADTFANGMEYFSTFGGNPVSCAIGRAVLKIVREEGLQEHAKNVGDYLKDHLRELQKRFPIIGAVRGHGLFLGFELVKDQESLEPAAREASYLANRMREKGILMSTDGPFYNVIKIKPPMCFTKENVDFLIGKLEEVLKEDFLFKKP